MPRMTPVMTRLGARLTLVLAVAIPLASGPAPSVALADGGSSRVMMAEDADGSAAALHVGIRQIAVGQPIPLTIVGVEPGSTWQIRDQASGTPLGTLTAGEDGTGTTSVSLPTATDIGDTAFLAVNGDQELATAATIGSTVTASADIGEAAADATEETPPVLLIASASALVLGVGGAATVLLRRRTRGAHTRHTRPETATTRH